VLNQKDGIWRMGVRCVVFNCVAPEIFLIKPGGGALWGHFMGDTCRELLDRAGTSPSHRKGKLFL